MTDIRDLIARALSAQTTCDGAPHPSELHYRQADAVLAVLAYLPDDVIEQGAIELFRDSWGDRPSAAKAGVRWNWLHDEEKQYWRSKVGLVFAAAFGGEQA